MSIRVAQIRLNRLEGEASVEDVLNEHIPADSIISTSTINVKRNEVVEPLLVVLFRA